MTTDIRAAADEVARLADLVAELGGYLDDFRAERCRLRLVVEYDHDFRQVSLRSGHALTLAARALGAAYEDAKADLRAARAHLEEVLRALDAP